MLVTLEDAIADGDEQRVMEQIRGLLTERDVEDFPGRHPWMHVLLGKGMVDAAKAVLPHIDLSATDSSGRHVLEIAVASGDVELCTLLLQRAEALGNAPFPADALKASISEVVTRGHEEICRLLIQLNADVAASALVDAISRHDDVAVTALIESGAPIDLPVQLGSTSRTALHCCASKPALLARLLSLVVDVDLRDSNGQSALSLAAASGNLAACEVLLKKGALLQLKDRQGRSPMFHACAHERKDVIRFFISHGESIDVTDYQGRTPLFYHAERGNVRGCLLMLSFHANLAHKDVTNETPMHAAASRGFKDLCRLFLAQDVSIDNTEEDAIIKVPSTPSTWISVTNDELLRIYGDILINGVDAVQTKLGTLMLCDLAMNSILHIAAEHADDALCVFIVRCLVASRVPADAENYLGHTPLSIAERRGLKLTVNFLKTTSGADHSSSDESSSDDCNMRIELGGTISRSAGVHVLTNGLLRFTPCTRSRLSQLCRGIESGVYTCSDDIVAQVDDEMGDTVLHFIIRDFCQRHEDNFPSDEDQRNLLLSPRWIGVESRAVRSFISKRNWEGKTPLHVAAEFGALGFCQALLHRGAEAGEECSMPDKRLVVRLRESCTYWKPINFAVSPSCEPSESNSSDCFQQREALVEYLMQQPDAFPTDKKALLECRDKIRRKFARLLPLMLHHEIAQGERQDNAEARSLFIKLLQWNGCLPTVERNQDVDPSGIRLHRILLAAQRNGPKSICKDSARHGVIETTGDTLLHLAAFHASATSESILEYLLSEAGLNPNVMNKHFKTPLHIACERRNVGVCAWLIRVGGADVTVSCRNLRVSHHLQWFTPLYCALWGPNISLDIVKILLPVPGSVVEPRNPRLNRSDMPRPFDKRWNRDILLRLIEVNPGALGQFLDHYCEVVSHLNGGVLYRFHEVRQVCENLRVILQPQEQTSDKYVETSCVTHPAVRNALSLKWKLFGLSCHRQQFCLYLLMYALFFGANIVSLRIDSRSDRDEDTDAEKAGSRFAWPDWTTPVGVLLSGCKFGCWGLAGYHLIYVELYLECLTDRKHYFRSVWNMLDIGTYILLLLTIPLEVLGSKWSTERSCALSIISVLLSLNLMQGLLVSSYFSVLIFTFARMCRVVGQFFIHYGMLLVGFSGGFYLLFHGRDPHVSFFSTMRVVFLATFGELNYNRNFYSAQSDSATNACAFMLLVFYVVVVMIVALNLMTALMTSEYEHVRSQAEERALLELAGALHRYEQWLGANVIKALYDSPRGLELIQSYEERILSSSRSRRTEWLGGACFPAEYNTCGRPTRLDRSNNYNAHHTSATHHKLETTTEELARRLLSEISSRLRSDVAAHFEELRSDLSSSSELRCRGRASTRCQCDGARVGDRMAAIETKVDALLTELRGLSSLK